jgi:hypothetical protein
MEKLHVQPQVGLLADIGAPGGGGTLVWTAAFSWVRVYAEVLGLSTEEKAHWANHQFKGKLSRALLQEEEPDAAGFAARHQFRTQDLNKDGGLLRAYVLHRAGAAPADVRGDGRLLTAQITAKGNDITPLQRLGRSLQQQKTYIKSWNSAAGIYVLDLDPEHDHLGLPTAGKDDELSFRYTSAAAAGGVVELATEHLHPNGRTK